MILQVGIPISKGWCGWLVTSFVIIDHYGPQGSLIILQTQTMHQFQRNSHKFTIHLDQVWFPPNLGNLMIPGTSQTQKYPLVFFWQHFFRAASGDFRRVDIPLVFFQLIVYTQESSLGKKTFQVFWRKYYLQKTTVTYPTKLGKFWTIIFSKCQFFWGDMWSFPGESNLKNLTQLFSHQTM